MPIQTINKETQICVDLCQQCHAACLDTITHCLNMGGEHANPEHIRLLMDCAQICATSADFMIRDSAYHMDSCGVCAKVCEDCAASCENLGKTERELQACMDICRRTSEACYQMSQTLD